MLSRCQTQRSSGCTKSWVRKDDTSTRSLIMTRWISPNIAQPQRYGPNIWQFPQKMPSISSKHLFSLFSKNPNFSHFDTHTFLYLKTHCKYLECIKLSNRVLSILGVLIIQIEQIIFRDASRSSRNDHSNQRVAIQPCFSSKTTCNFINWPICCVCKTG